MVCVRYFSVASARNTPRAPGPVRQGRYGPYQTRLVLTPLCLHKFRSSFSSRSTECNIVSIASLGVEIEGLPLEWGTVGTELITFLCGMGMSMHVDNRQNLLFQ